MNKRALYQLIQHLPAESPEEAIAIVQRETHADPFTMLIRDFGMTYAELAGHSTTAEQQSRQRAVSFTKARLVL
jgi:hypothetical protein